MQFNRDEYVFLSRRGSVPVANRAGPRSRPEPGGHGRAEPVAPLVRRLAQASRVAIREFRIALEDGGEQHRAR